MFEADSSKIIILIELLEKNIITSVIVFYYIFIQFLAGTRISAHVLLINEYSLSLPIIFRLLTLDFVTRN